jgi:hypothetical protein
MPDRINAPLRPAPSRQSVEIPLRASSLNRPLPMTAFDPNQPTASTHLCSQ